MKRIFPHITLVLSLMVMTFFVIDRFNEIMAFMTSELSKYVIAALAVCSLITSVCLITENFKADTRSENRRLRLEQKRNAARLSEEPRHSEALSSDK